MTEWPIRREWGNEVIADGGKLTIESGGEVDLEAGSALKIAGTQVTATAAELNALHAQGAVAADYAKLHAITKSAAAINGLVEGVAGAYKLARGQHTSVAASDTVATGLATVVAAVACLDDDPGADPIAVSCSIGDQAGAPVAGSIYIKTWQPTHLDTDSTPKAATTFGKKINWIAIGT